MALILTRPKQVPTPQPASVFPDVSARWLVALRWVAILGMLVTTLAGAALHPGLNPRPILVVLLILAGANLGWWWVGRGQVDPSHRTVNLQIGLDVLFLGLVLWFSGGVSNPFACFMSFQIVLAGLLGDRRTLVSVGGLAALTLVTLAWAPPLPSADPVQEEELLALARELALLALGAFTGFFVLVSMRRLEMLHDRASREEKMAALGRSVAAMAHELNTPLGTIVLAARELAEVSGGSSDSEVRKLTTTVVEEAQRASNVVGLLRGYVKPDAQRERVNLSEMVPAWVSRETERLGFKGNKVLHVGEQVQGMGIPAALGQILVNLVANAVDAMQSVQNPTLTIHVQLEDEQARVVVEDNGPGMAAERMARLGEPFHSTKTERGGMGLGLYVSALLAEKMDAVLALESAPGKGTRVTLLLPRAAAGFEGRG